ncbi:MAG: hypothetical protein H7Y31_10265 [Chitinophagaceae bacterium]|nr:hypothetical protein [Chitinophagaceae bacterium]
MSKIVFKGKIRMNKLVQFLGILLVLSCNAFAQDRTWKTFSPDNGAWSIFAPDIMNPDKEALESPSTMGSYSYNDSNGFFAVIYRDTPEGRILWKPFKKAHFKRVRNDFIKSNKGQLLKIEKFSNGNLKGREVYIKVPESRVMGRESQVKTKYRVQRLRMFFHDRRFYLLLAVLPEEEIDAPVINNYFNSFTVK